MTGLSWLAVEMTSSLPPLFTSQAQPEPKRVAPAAFNFLFERVEAAEGAVDRRSYVAGGRAAAVRPHDLSRTWNG